VQAKARAIARSLFVQTACCLWDQCLYSLALHQRCFRPVQPPILPVSIMSGVNTTTQRSETATHKRAKAHGRPNASSVSLESRLINHQTPAEISEVPAMRMIHQLRDMPLQAL
jgi:hypothetical protein